jgi:hypothetical protein
MANDTEIRKVLLVCANPSGSDRIRVDREERALREAIQLSPHRDKISITSLQAATVDDLHRALLRDHFDVVHFSGHGTNRGLVFEDTEGRIFVPSSQALGRLFGKHGVSAVLLNACYSLTVGQLSALDVDFTIASPCPIDDGAAIEFSRGFYDALGSDHSIPDSFDAGKDRAELKNLAIDLVILKRGETFVAEKKSPGVNLNRNNEVRRTEVEPANVLLGIAIDTSGSMQESIQNDRNTDVSRLDSVNQAFQSVWKNLQKEQKTRALDGHPQLNNVRVFAYLFGTRIVDFVDLLSFLKAARAFDLEAEATKLQRSYENKARSAEAQYGGWAQLARNYGFGSTVDQLVTSAKAQAKTEIVAELAQRIRSRASAIGDVTTTITELYELWGDGGSAIGNPDFQEFLFGSTPMCATMVEIRKRFERTSPAAAHEQRVLLFISDGMPTDGDPSESIRQIRSSGVCVITCFVSGNDVVEPHVLYAEQRPEWPEEAKLMHSLASTMDMQGLVANELLSKGWRIEPEAKLFLQVNHSRLFQEFVDAVTDSLVMPKAGLLPAGR